MVSKDGGSDIDIAAGIEKARAAFICLSLVWWSKLIDSDRVPVPVSIEKSV